MKEKTISNERWRKWEKCIDRSLLFPSFFRFPLTLSWCPLPPPLPLFLRLFSYHRRPSQTLLGIVVLSRIVALTHLLASTFRREMGIAPKVIRSKEILTDIYHTLSAIERCHLFDHISEPQIRTINSNPTHLFFFVILQSSTKCETDKSSQNHQSDPSVTTTKSKHRYLSKPTVGWFCLWVGSQNRETTEMKTNRRRLVYWPTRW